jgi:hypothetical protein
MKKKHTPSLRRVAAMIVTRELVKVLGGPHFSDSIEGYLAELNPTPEALRDEIEAVLIMRYQNETKGKECFTCGHFPGCLEQKGLTPANGVPFPSQADVLCPDFIHQDMSESIDAIAMHDLLESLHKHYGIDRDRIYNNC